MGKAAADHVIVLMVDGIRSLLAEIECRGRLARAILNLARRNDFEPDLPAPARKDGTRKGSARAGQHGRTSSVELGKRSETARLGTFRGTCASAISETRAPQNGGKDTKSSGRKEVLVSV